MKYLLIAGGLGALFYLLTNSERKRNALLAHPEIKNSLSFREVILNATPGEIETIHTLMFFYPPRSDKVIPVSSELYNKLVAIGKKYNIFT